jgi:hypothetical protein
VDTRRFNSASPRGAAESRCRPGVSACTTTRPARPGVFGGDGVGSAAPVATSTPTPNSGPSHRARTTSARPNGECSVAWSAPRPLPRRSTTEGQPAHGAVDTAIGLTRNGKRPASALLKSTQAPGRPSNPLIRSPAAKWTKPIDRCPTGDAPTPAPATITRTDYELPGSWFFPVSTAESDPTDLGLTHRL